MIKPIFSTVAVAAMAAALVSCGPQQPPAAAPAAAPSSEPAPGAATSRAYQTVVIPGSASASVGVLRVNIATGQVTVGWGDATTMQPIADLTLPAGQYHLVGWSQPAASDGSVAWGVVRVDTVSGRVWTLNGGTVYNWIEMVPTS